MQTGGIRSRGVAAIPDEERLDGWKAIANFLGRERSTAIRWAKQRGLPVHRVPGGRTGTVYALRSELDAWLSGDREEPAVSAPPVDPPAKDVPKAADRRDGTRVLLAALAAFAALLAILFFRQAAAADPPVSVAATASLPAGRDTLEFARGLNADLARFANASPDLAVFEGEPGAAPTTAYAVRTEIERANATMIATARLISVEDGQVIWAHRFEQSGPSLAALRERVAASIVGLLRCSFGGLASERAKARVADLQQIMAICFNLDNDDLAAATVHAQQLTRTNPELGLGWAILATIEGYLAGQGNHALQAQAVADSQRAAAIAPGNVSTWVALAAASGQGPTNPQALHVIDEALRMHPNDPRLLNFRSVILFNLGYVQASAADALQSVRSDPSSFNGRDIAVRRLAATGRTEEALQLQAENEDLWPGHPEILANRAQLASNEPGVDANAAAIARYEREFAATPQVAYLLARLYEQAGDRRTALAWLARAPVDNALQQWSLLFWPAAAGLRTEPAFFDKMARLGLVSWWVARGQWPDFCAQTDLKYDCAERSKGVGQAPQPGP